MYEESIAYFFCHIVPIKITMEKAGERTSWYVSAFVMSVQDYWFLVTAGHCLQKIDNALDEGYRLVTCEFIDFLGSEAKNERPIPFVYQRDAVHYFYEEGSYDYGLIPLSQYYVCLLERNNICPLNEEVWKKQPSSPVGYVLIGIPDNWVEFGEQGDFVNPILLLVEKVEEKLEIFKDDIFPFFYGKVEYPDNLQSLRGMSGGPIFAFQQGPNGEWRYWVIALQSSEYRLSQYIKACPLGMLGQYLEEIIENMNTKTNLHDEC